MKIAYILLALTVSGCTYNQHTHPLGASCGHGAVYPTSQYTLVNNSGYKLKVYQDGRYLTDLPVGEVQSIKGTLLWRKTVVTVTGLDDEDHYVGSASWIYEFGVPEAWTVMRLNKPQEPR